MNMPFSGGVWDQDSGLMALIHTAWQAWYVWSYKPKNKMQWGPEDRDFMAWASGESDG